MAVVSVSLPDDLVAAMDAAVRNGGHQGRSAWVRVALRHYLAAGHEAADADDAHLDAHMHGSITVTYPHGHDARISEVRHAFHDVVLSLMHTHCEADTCMDVLIVGGTRHRIHGLRDALQRVRAVRDVALVSADG